MKAKNLVLTLALFLLLPLLHVSAAIKTDAFDCTTYGGVSGELSFGSLPSASGAVYGGSISFSKMPTKHAVMTNAMKVYTTTSPGTAKSVSLTWRGSGNTSSESTIKVYGKHTAFTGGEDPATLASIDGVELIGSATYISDSYTDIIDVSSYGYEYIAIATGTMQIDFLAIAITWTVPDVAKYEVDFTKTGSGYVWVEPEAASYAAGTSLTAYFYGLDDGTELQSYSIDGVTTVLGEDDYSGYVEKTFTMPSHDITINAVFAAAPSPARVANPISVDGVADKIYANVKSGTESSFVISTLYNSGTSPAYNKTLKSVTSSNTDVVEVVSNTYNSASGSGTLTLRGKITGVATVTISTYQTNGTLRSEREIVVTVVGRDVALITELNGKYYAVQNSVGGATTAAQEVFRDGDKYYYKSGVNLSDISWKAENTADGYFIRNAGGKYLKVAGTTMSLADASYEWYKNAGERLVTGYTTGLAYDESYTAFTINGQNDYLSVSSISACVYEVSISNVLPATEYTRSLTNGNYATMCLPFAVSRSETFFSGVTVFQITGKDLSGSSIRGIEMEEVEGMLEAGKPYIIQASASAMSAWHGDDEVALPVSATGLVGNLGSSYAVPVGNYVISSNKIRKVVYSGTANVGQYRAYLNLDAVPEVGGASAPGRRVLYVESTTTSVEDLLENATLINWNEPVYNMLGQRVGKGTKGVLIQNGQKFMVQ